LILIAFCAVLLYLVYTMVFPQKKIVYDQTNKTFVVKGDVKIKKAGEGSSWQKMSTSTVLEKGDCIETSEDSSTDVIMGGNTEKTVKIGPRSRIEI